MASWFRRPRRFRPHRRDGDATFASRFRGKSPPPGRVWGPQCVPAGGSMPSRFDRLSVTVRAATTYRYSIRMRLRAGKWRPPPLLSIIANPNT